MMFGFKSGQLFGVFAVAFFVLAPSLVSGRIGVGVGLGKIELDEPLKAGGIYDLPALPVLNTGDEPGQYEVSIEYHEGVPQLRPAREWFDFEPRSFHLDPGQVQVVGTTLTLPAKTQPGDYFAYVEAHPLQRSENGKTSIGVAAAAKLYFTVAPSNVFQGAYYRFISVYSRYHPWDTVVLTVIAAAILLRFLGKRFKIQIAKR